MRFLSLLLLLLFGHAVQAQEQMYKFKHLNISEGLSQSSVIAIEQDTLGRMWLGTRDGLNRYDGNTFKVYRNDVVDSTSISNSDILAITEDSDGYIWVGTHNGLNRYDPFTDTFKKYFHAADSASVCHNTVRSIVETANGELWIGTSKGLSIYDRNTDSFTSFLSDGKTDIAPLSGHILSIFQTDKNTVWLGTSEGFYKVTGRDKTAFEFQRFKPRNSSEQPYVQTIANYDKSSLYVGTKNMGLLKFDLISERFVTHLTYGENLDVRAITQETNGDLWIGTSDGIHIFKRNGNHQKLVNKPLYEGSLTNNYIKSFYKDKKGSIWIGSYNGGVDIWDASNINFINYSEMSRGNELSHKVVSSIEVDAQNNLYFGTEGGGITIFKADEDETKYLNTSNSDALLSNTIKSLLVDKKMLWVGTLNKGLKVYNLTEQKFDPTLISEELGNLLSDSGVYAIEKGLGNSLWIGSFDKGLIQYNITDKSYVVFNKGIESQGLSSRGVRNLMVDKNFNIWVGTARGLNLLTYSAQGYHEKNITHFFYDENTNSEGDIQTIYQDTSGVIWVGVRAKGLFRFNGSTFDQVPIKTDKIITSIYAILEDEDNTLWMSSNQGLIHYNIKQGTSTLYTRKDGLVGNEFNGGALKIRDSEFYFGGPAGVSFFNSKRLVKNDFAPQVILTDFKIKNEKTTQKEDAYTLPKSLPFVDAIELEHDKANFSISFAITNFINPSNNQYQYRMLGLEENWTASQLTQVNYTIQKPGEYIFEVKGANNDGVWNTTPTRLTVTVRPAPWRSNWAYVLYTLLIVSALVGLGNMLRSRTRLKHRLELEHVENLRNKEVNDAKLRFFTNISHEFRTPLTLITGPLQQLLQDYKGSSVVYKKLLVIESNANHLLQLINRLMDFRKLEHKRFELEAAEGNIVEFLTEIYLSFTEYAKTKGYEYTFHSGQDEILVYYDRPKLEQVFYNLLSNAFKYTPPNGMVSVSIATKRNKILIDINDSGPGIPAAYRDKVFERFFEIPDYKKSENIQGSGTGIGLSIAKSIVDLHKGTVKVLGNDGMGSIFRVELLLGKAHLSETQITEDFKFSDDVGLYATQNGQPVLNGQHAIDKSNELLLDEEKDTLLLVEDNVPLRNFIKDLLKDEYNVIEAGDGQEGMKKALKYVPSLIVSDVVMPIMAGTEFCAKIKENIKTSHIPVILLTSRTSLLYKFEGLENGADDYISKPFDVREFKLRIKNMIDSSKRLRAKFAEKSDYTPNEIVVSSIDERLLKKALQIVEDNISNHQFDIPTFSSDLGVSRTLLFTKIKAWTNFTPNEFIHEIRMKRAVQILEQGKMNISQVSYMVGFKSPKYFSKCFQKRYGTSPKRYREKFSSEFVS